MQRIENFSKFKYGVRFCRYRITDEEEEFFDKDPNNSA